MFNQGVPIPDYENLYRIDFQGNVYSVIKRCLLVHRNLKTNKYRSVLLYKNGKYKIVNIDKIVKDLFGVIQPVIFIKKPKKKYIYIPDEINSIVSKNISFYRVNLCYSRNSICDATGVSVAMISYYETNRRKIPTSFMVKLASLFKINLHEFLIEDDSYHDLNVTILKSFDKDKMDERHNNSLLAFKTIVQNYIKMKNIKI